MYVYIDVDVDYLDKSAKLDINNGNKIIDDLFSNRFKNDVGIILIEANSLLNLGSINYVNTATIEILELSNKSEILHKNISVFQPSTVGNFHDKILQNYFEKGKSSHLRKTLINFCIKNKDKYLVPIYLVISILPSFSHNIEGIGIMRKKPKEEEIIIINEFGVIDSLTEKIGSLLGIKPISLEKNQYYLQHFIPEIMDPNSGKNGIPIFFESDYVSKRINQKIALLLPDFKTIKNVGEGSLNNLNFKTMLMKANLKKYEYKYNVIINSMHKKMKNKVIYDLMNSIFEKLNYSKIYRNIIGYKEVKMSHTCVKFFNGQEIMRNISFPSESLTDDKNNNNGSGSNEKTNLDNLALTSQDKEGQLMETSSMASGKTVALEFYLKSIREMKNISNASLTNNLNFLILIASTLGTTIICMYYFYDMLNSGKYFIDLNDFTYNTIIDVCIVVKFSILSFIQKYMFEGQSPQYNNINTLHTNYSLDLLQVSQSLHNTKLKNIDDIFKEINYSLPLKQEIISPEYLSLSVIPKSDFITIITKLISNGISISKDNLLYNIMNFHYLPMSIFFGFFRNTKDKILSILNNDELIANVIMLIFLIIVVISLSLLYFSYKKKKAEHNLTLSAYELIDNSDVEEIIKKLDIFKKIYFSNHDNDFESASKKTSVIKSYTIEDNNIYKQLPNKDINNKKHIYNRNTISVDYILEVIIVFLFIFCFQIIMYIIFENNKNSSRSAFDLSKNILESKFFVNYQGMYTLKVLFDQRNLINEKNTQNNMIKMNNYTLNHYMFLSTNIAKNQDFFYLNITKIINGNVCDEIPKLKYCNFSSKISNSFNINKDKVKFIREFYSNKIFNLEISGLGSIINYYMETCLDIIQKNELNITYGYFQENIKTINNFNFYINYSEDIQALHDLSIIINSIYQEIFLQLKNTYENHSYYIFNIMIGLSVFFNFIFALMIMMKLQQVLNKLYKEDILSKRLIGEIPNEIILKNSQLIHNLNKVANSMK